MVCAKHRHPEGFVGPVAGPDRAFRRRRDTNLSDGLEPVEVDADPVGGLGALGDERPLGALSLRRSELEEESIAVLSRLKTR